MATPEILPIAYKLQNPFMLFIYMYIIASDPGVITDN